MKIYISVLLLLFSLTACKKTKEARIEINKQETAANRIEGKMYSFDFPEDWSITDNEVMDEGVSYLSIEKKGFDSSGLMSIVSFDKLMDLDELINLNVQEFQDNPLISSLNFESIVENKFNDIDSRSSNFKFSAIGIEHKGTIYGFNSKSSSYVILRQEAREDKKANAQGFKTIENSFSVN